MCRSTAHFLIICFILGPTARLRKQFFLWLRQLPIVRNTIEKKMSEIKKDFKRDVAKRLAGVTVRRELPATGLSAEQVAEEVRDHVALGKKQHESCSLFLRLHLANG